MNGASLKWQSLVLLSIECWLSTYGKAKVGTAFYSSAN